MIRRPWGGAAVLHRPEFDRRWRPAVGLLLSGRDLLLPLLLRLRAYRWQGGLLLLLLLQRSSLSCLGLLLRCGHCWVL